MSSTPLPPAPMKAVELDRPRFLRCDLQAMRLFKRETGISLLAGVGVEQAIAREPEMVLPALIWALAAHDDPDLTIEHVAACLHPGNLEATAETIVELIAEAMPEPEEGSETDPPTADSAS